VRARAQWRVQELIAFQVGALGWEDLKELRTLFDHVQFSGFALWNPFSECHGNLHFNRWLLAAILEFVVAHSQYSSQPRVMGIVKNQALFEMALRSKVDGFLGAKSLHFFFCPAEPGQAVEEESHNQSGASDDN
jgi:hypothetical protein